jgi:hypothetical protein
MTMAKISQSLLLVAQECAKRIEQRAAEVGMAYCAGQSAYGVSIEMHNGRLRFFDCDGNRSDWMASEWEVHTVCKEWLSRCVGEMPVA